MKAWNFFRSILFLIFEVVTVIFFSVVGQLFWLASAKTRYQFIHYWARGCVVFLKYVCGVKYRVHGLEHVDASNSGLVLARHESTWETFAFQEFLPPHAYVLKQELLRVPFFGWGLKLMSPIAIDRGAGRKAMKQVLDQGVARLAEGFWVVIFPEGTRMASHTLGKINSGGALLAKKAGVPVHLIAHNAGTVWPSGRIRIRPGTVDVYISPALDVSEMTVDEINQKTEEWFRTHSAVGEQ